MEERESARRRGRFRLRTPSRWRNWLILAIFAGGILGVAASELAFPLAGCAIKGNVSVLGERIYHVPGQRYYQATRINWLRGERYFCSEADARGAGFRRARI